MPLSIMAMTIRLAIPRAAWPRKGLGFVKGHSTALPSASPQTASEHRQCSPGWGRLLGQQPHTCKQHRRGSSPRGCELCQLHQPTVTQVLSPPAMRCVPPACPSCPREGCSWPPVPPLAGEMRHRQMQSRAQCSTAQLLPSGPFLRWRTSQIIKLFCQHHRSNCADVPRSTELLLALQHH